MRRLTILAALGAIAVAVPAGAATIALQGLNGDELFTAGQDLTMGWSFTVNSPIAVTALGVFDSAGDGFGASWAVALFANADQQLLLSTTIGAGTAADRIGSFRYRVADRAAGRRHLHDRRLRSPAQLRPLSGAGRRGDVRTRDYLSHRRVHGAWLGSGLPWSKHIPEHCLFGPNFLFEAVEVPPPPAVPAPSVAVLLGLGLALLAPRLRRPAA